MDTIFCYLKGCIKCGGDLVFDEGDWRCWQCGQYYYATPSEPMAEPPPDPPSYPQGSDEAEDPLLGGDPPGGETLFNPKATPDSPGSPGPTKKRRGYGARSERNINSVIRAKTLSEERWRARNQKIIECLEQGLSVREIVRLVQRGERQIRVVRERLADLRAERAEQEAG